MVLSGHGQRSRWGAGGAFLGGVGDGVGPSVICSEGDGAEPHLPLHTELPSPQVPACQGPTGPWTLTGRGLCQGAPLQHMVWGTAPSEHGGG